MKQMLFTTILFLSILIAKGQQLSYRYDATGNRTTRSIIVSTQGLSQHTQNKRHRFYSDSLSGNDLLITSKSGSSKLLIEFRKHKYTRKGKYSISDTNGKVLRNANLSTKATAVDLDTLPNGNYILTVYLSSAISNWNLQKL